ncbi:carbohydrate ABC transporter permease [Jiangella alkaliphila]|uniref:Carbohydrate ABC transporter membrane protein 1, CUT1 family n=1 Tax=Jiangella alkaliphila TaxID=419479 RepID=A0A1H2KVQ5_9ACTN|nr:sugar ABC transporter permease [Jiangella alkaliphila]SDU72769.1 carbohydrate ABC transporter membrane protein 1, CUT1 family [Jiangella alkaliphila]
MTLERTAAPRPTWRQRVRDPGWGLIFVLPMLVLFVIFRFVPSLGAVGMSFTDYRLSGEFTFIGAENYRRLIEDDLFFDSLRVTLLYALMYVPLTLVVSLGTATMLHHVVRGRGLFRGLLFLPYVTSFVMAGIIWIWIYQSDGLINGALERIGLGPVAFLTGNQAMVLGSLAIVSVWKSFGYSMLILLAGLKNIPEDLMEAATLDGAGAWAKFRRITLPLLRPVIFFVLVIETIVAFQVFDTIYVMTGGGPARASYGLVYMLYDQGFKFFDFGYAATIGVMLFLVVLVISLVQRYVLDRENT